MGVGGSSGTFCATLDTREGGGGVKNRGMGERGM